MQTQNFNILDRNTDIHKNLLIEASAGTGKTFSIENLYIRLLLEEVDRPPLNVEDILVVTFTKAATRELKFRIHQLLDFSVKALKDEKNVPDYLQIYLEKGSEVKKAALRRLEKALFSFDDARIFTIHGFCERVLTETSSGRDQELLKAAQALQVIRDYFQTEIREGAYGKNQIELLLRKNGFDFLKLEGAILKEIQKGTAVEKGRTFQEIYEEFIRRFHPMLMNLDREKVLEDFHTIGKNYKILNKKNEIKKEYSTSLDIFCDLVDKKKVSKEDFEVLIQYGLVYTIAFDQKNLRCKAALPSKNELHYPDFLEQISNEISPLLKEASSPAAIFSRIVYDCKILLKNYLDREGKYRYDDLILSLAYEVQSEEFLQKIREIYKAAIIDEFQDTDPLQWKIFEKIFLNTSKKHWIYLVGDPKQSIYSFRDADIYTYMSAKYRIGESNTATLGINYRSSPSLIKNLNILFDQKRVPNFIHLPKKFSTIPYQHVLPCDQITDADFSDHLGSLHFILMKEKKGRKKNWPTKDLEEEQLFPYIAGQIRRLKKEKDVDYSRWAILVRDRHQADRVAGYLERHHIPSHKQRDRYLTDSCVYDGMIELLKGVLNPGNINQIKMVLGGQFFRWCHHEIKELEQQDLLCSVVNQFQILHLELYQNGFSTFIEKFLTMPKLNGNETVGQSLLHSDEDREVFQDLMQLSDFLIDFQSHSTASPKEILNYLEKQKMEKFNENDALKVRQNRFLDAVQILTLHSSKGLEFDIVVSIGLMNRNTIKDDLYPCKQSEETVLRPLLQEDDADFLLYKKELDAEKMRLLYVALTRAKYRIYYPVLFQEDLPANLDVGEASPNELFFSQLLDPDLDPYETVSNLTMDPFLEMLTEIEEKTTITHVLLDKSESQLEPIREECISIFPPLKVSIPEERQSILSFSSIEKSKGVEVNTVQTAPYDFNVEKKDIHTLPAGRETGILLHEIFEKIPLSHQQKIQKTISEMIMGSPYEEWQSTIEKLVDHVLQTQVTLENGFSFSLKGLSENNSYREVEFLEKTDDGFMKGIIDLVFEHDGKYYLIDWKSNWLGLSDDQYGAEQLSQAMQQHHYFLQAKIYRNALKKYLSVFINEPFEEVFGGTIYFFLRGVYNQKTHGIYYAGNS